eukprot:TRINITY_DN7146_c1_g1_i1.p1 TRINITY_DN7146_c1_g1~~TRINITY_DN7146_c1_g1_i1.p1  ORF type:complete len:543 (+),score=68.03 TRINITY_DN7146_c1_g1_i1:279-1907(+)
MAEMVEMSCVRQRVVGFEARGTVFTGCANEQSRFTLDPRSLDHKDHSRRRRAPGGASFRTLKAWSPHVRAAVQDIARRDQQQKCAAPEGGGGGLLQQIRGGVGDELVVAGPRADAGRVRSRAGRAPASRCPEARLYRLLRRLGPEARREVLSRKLSETQRLALERWILSELPAAMPHRLSSGRRPIALAVAEAASAAHRCCDGKVTLQPTPSRTCPRPPRSGARGVHIRVKSGRVSYCVSALAGPFMLSTGYFADFAFVLGLREMVEDLRARLVAIENVRSSGASVGSGHGCSARLARDAVAAELRQFCPHVAAAMGLRFSVVIPAKYWVGTALKTPQFSACSQLEAGLRAWHKLVDARGTVHLGRTNRYTLLRRFSPGELEATWLRLRSAYLDVWADAGFPRDRVARRLEMLEARHRSRWRPQLPLRAIGARGGAEYTSFAVSDCGGKRSRGDQASDSVSRGADGFATIERRLELVLTQWARARSKERSQRSATSSSPPRKRCAARHCDSARVQLWRPEGSPATVASVLGPLTTVAAEVGV